MIDKITIGSVEIKSDGGNYLLHNHSGFAMPELRINMQNKGNTHGAKLIGYYYGKRTFSIEGLINATSASDLETYRKALETALRIDNGLQEMTILTKGGSTLTAQVILESIEMKYNKGEASFGSFLIQVSAENSWLKSDVLNSQDVLVFEGGGGEIPAEIPFSLGNGGTGATIINNSGNGNASPVVNIYGPIINPSLTNDTSGEALSLIYTLTNSTEYIEVDMENKTIKLNGITNILSSLTSGNFWDLLSGNNTVKLTCSSYDSGAKATFYWYDSYLGI